VSVFLVLILGLIIWQLIKAASTRSSKEMPLTSDDAEEGGASAPAVRLCSCCCGSHFRRSFVIVSLIMLSLSGRHRAADRGAGVIVWPSASALRPCQGHHRRIFFLIDDAFRVGDYVEAGLRKARWRKLA